MSIGLGGNANASVGVDGSASAGASVDGGIGGSLAGALGGSLSAGIGLAGSLALSASASLAASASFGAGFSFGSSGPAPVLGARPPDILPNYKFMVQFQSLGPMRFQSISGIVATQTMAAPPTPTPPAGPANSAAHSTGPGARNNTAHPAPAAPPASQGVSAASTTHVGQGGAGGSATRLPRGNWTWTDLTLKRGVAKDGLALTNWIWPGSKAIVRRGLI